MSAASWIPSTIVLLVGLAVGGWAAWRLRHRTPHAPSHGRKIRDLELRLEDLEVRRDDLYRRLRGEGARPVEARERPMMEISAARALREIDAATAELAELRTEAAAAAPAAAPEKAAPGVGAAEPPVESSGAPAEASTEAPRGFAARHPLMVGFAFGAGMVGLVGLLIFWALQDAKPGPRAAPTPGGLQTSAPEASVGGMPAGAHPEDFGELDPQATAQIEALRQQLAERPNDVRLRKELAVTLLSHNQFMGAFEQARQVLEVAPDDPDGLYVIAVVRLTMGQAETSVEILDQVVQRFPQHVLAHVVRGMALVQLGDGEAAIRSWERGLEAAGGRHPEIEQLIAEARGAAGASTALGPSLPAAAAAPEDDDGTPRVYRVEVELAPGVSPPAGAALFVVLQDPRNPAGQPAAVRRVAEPSFPLELSLDARDSMAGLSNLPATGRLVVWLDNDGDMTPQSPGEISASADARYDQKAVFVLR